MVDEEQQREVLGKRTPKWSWPFAQVRPGSDTGTETSQVESSDFSFARVRT